jgi:hypothetical protein
LKTEKEETMQSISYPDGRSQDAPNAAEEGTLDHYLAQATTFGTEGVYEEASRTNKRKDWT